MSNNLKTIASFCLLVGTIVVGALGCGTDPEEACDIICTKSAECQTGSTKATCLATCKEQAKDEAYGDAIVEQSECYQDATCADLSSNMCVPQDI